MRQHITAICQLRCECLVRSSTQRVLIFAGFDANNTGMTVQSGMSYGEKGHALHHLGQILSAPNERCTVADQGNLLHQLKTDSMQDLVS